MWKIGSKLIREANPDDGVGVVVGVEHRFIDVHFPKTDTRLRLSPEAAGIEPFQLLVGTEVDIDGAPETISSIKAGVATLADGTVHNVEELWPFYREKTLIERLIDGEVDRPEDVAIRLDGYRYLERRRQGTVTSLMGGRVELFPHQLDTAARAIDQETVRWMLADEVGLGKTIVACQITSAMVRMGRAERVLVVCPETLTVQWLGELYRKFHQVFVHIDEERLRHVATDFGADANPFDIHQLGIISIDLLQSRPDLIERLSENPPEMIVIDEAHRILNSDIEYEVLPYVEHALLLTATPFHAGTTGFVRMVKMLDLPYSEKDGKHVAGQVSMVTRDDIHALGQREPHPVEVDSVGELDSNESRVAWLVEQVKLWKKNGERALVFVDDAERAKELKSIVEREALIAAFAFHEEMNTAARDIELSRFKLSNSPIMISSGAGSEGRNFQFCDILVHFDLPIDPVVLEQRIGRVDRIGRTSNIPIYYFKTPDDYISRIYESIGIFESASIGSSPALSGLRSKLAFGAIDVDQIPEIVRELLDGVEDERENWQFPDSHSKSDGERVLAELPEGQEELVERFCFERAERIGLDVVEKEGFSVYFFEYTGNEEVEAVPGLRAGDRFLGSFKRQEAIDNELIDFFASGHPLVEALLAELEDSPHGRVGALSVSPELLGLKGAFLFLLYGRRGAIRPVLRPLAAQVPSREALRDATRRAFEQLSEHPALGKAQTKALANRYLAEAKINTDDLASAVLLVAI